MRRLAALVTVAALALVACTGGGSTEPTGDSSPVGGQAVCDEPTILAAIQEDFAANYPGSTFVAMDSFTCAGGWAMADVEFEASGSTFPTVVYLRAEGQFWIPTTIEEICATPKAESGVPEEIYVAACGVQ